MKNSGYAFICYALAVIFMLVIQVDMIQTVGLSVCHYMYYNSMFYFKVALESLIKLYVVTHIILANLSLLKTPRNK